MSFTTFKRIFCGAVVLGFVSACGGEEAPVVKAEDTKDLPAVKLEAQNVVPYQTEQAAQPEITDQENIPVGEVAEDDTASIEDQERQQTIRSIIEQLQQRDAFSKLREDAEAKEDTPVSEGLTTTTLREASPAAEDKVVWSIDAGQGPKEVVQEPVIPEGRDPSLAAEALAAAFALVRDHTDVSDTLVQEEGTPINVIAKPEQGIRAAVLAPLNGRAASIGREMQFGAELAIFTLGQRHIDLTFHDTSEDINLALNAAMLQKPDIIIGPLFADHTQKAKPVARFADIPVLSFSNDSAAAGQGAWLLGPTPEQEIETVVQHALDTLTPLKEAGREKLSVGLVVQDNPYGSRISQHAVNILIGRGDVTAEMLTLNAEVLADEIALRESIKNLTKWLPPSSEGESQPPRFDIVIIAGDVSFGLRVAPVLSWYDLDPRKVQYLGTSQWTAAAILQEPSLEGGWFASQSAASAEQFQSLWKVTNQTQASKYAMMAFDAVALVSTLDRDHPLGMTGALTDGPGFNGFSGAFKLNPGGESIRPLEIRQIKTGGFDVIVPAKATF